MRRAPCRRLPLDLVDAPTHRRVRAEHVRCGIHLALTMAGLDVVLGMDNLSLLNICKRD